MKADSLELKENSVISFHISASIHEDSEGNLILVGYAGGLTWNVISTNTSAVSLNGYLIDASSTNITLLLPPDPDVGTQIAAGDYTDSAETNTITIDRNGKNIEGAASDYIISVNGQKVYFVFSGDTKGWIIVAGIKQ